LILGIGLSNHPAGAKGDSSVGELNADEVLRERREAYRELRTRMEPSEALTALASQIEADVSAAWRGEAFLAQPNVMKSIVALVQTHVSRSPKYVSGSCEVAALLLFVMITGGTEVADAEADAFWCFSELMAEIEDSTAGDVRISLQARRLHSLLRVYDPPLATLLAELGLAALPAMRLGSFLCTRAGFTFSSCASMWDCFLGDPRRFVARPRSWHRFYPRFHGRGAVCG